MQVLKSMYKGVSVAVLGVFLVTTLVVPTAAAKPVSKEGINPSEFRIPSCYGRVSFVSGDTKAKKMVVHIQDAHCNYTAQQNISAILENITSKYDIKLVGVEGAKGWVDTAILNAIPGSVRRREINRGLLAETIIDGATEFAANQDEINTVLFGVESRELYLNNLKAYADLSSLKKGALGQVEKITSALNSLKPHVLNKELVEFVDKKGNVPLREYLSYLAQIAEEKSVALKDYPNINILLDSAKMEEEIDFIKVNDERAQLIDSLNKSLDKENLKNLIAKSLEFRAGEIEPVEYYGYLESFNSEWKEYPNLGKYISYVKVRGGLDRKGLLNERDSLASVLKEILIKNEIEKTLVSLCENIQLVEKYFKIELTRNEYMRYVKNEDEFSGENFTAFIKENAPKYGMKFSWQEEDSKLIETARESATRFYTAALKREEVFVKNLLRQMDKDKLNIAALVTGGFHTDRIKEILEDKGVSYVVVKPMVEEGIGKEKYNAMMGQLAGSFLGATANTYMALINILEAGISRGTIPLQKDSLIGYLVKHLGFPNDTSAIRKLEEIAGRDLSKYPKLAKVLAAMKKEKADYQASIYAEVASGLVTGRVEELYQQLLEDLSGMYGRLITTAGIAHWNFRNQEIELSENALKLFSLIIAKGIGGFTYDEIRDYLLGVVIPHEQAHRDTPYDSSIDREIAINTEEVGRLRQLETRHKGILNKLIELYNGNLASTEVKYQADRNYSEFLIGITHNQDAEILAQTMVERPGAITVGAIVGKLESADSQGKFRMLDAEMFKVAVNVSVAEVPMTDGTATYIQGKGFASVAAENSIEAPSVGSIVDTIDSSAGLDNIARAINGVRADVVKTPEERLSRLILSSVGSAVAENLKSVIAAEQNAIQEVTAALAQSDGSYIQQYELDMVNALRPEELAAFRRTLTGLSQIRGEGGQQVIHIQFIDNTGNAVDSSAIADSVLKTLHTVDLTGVKVARTIRVIDIAHRDNYRTLHQEGVHYLPVGKIFDGVAVLASAVVDNEDFLREGDLNYLSQFVRCLFSSLYSLQQGEFTEAHIRAIFNSPWDDILRQILFAPMPVETVDYEAIQRMREMTAIAA